MPESGTDRLRTRTSLLGKLRNWNDHASWQRFNDNYWHLIHNYVLKQGVKENDAKDLVQETLVSVAKAFRKGQFDPKQGSFKSWLLRVTHNRVTDHFRRRPHWQEARRTSRPATTRTSTTDRVPDPRTLTPQAIWDQEWRNNVMELALEKLKAKVKLEHFQIFHLHVIKEQPARTVAKAFGVSEGQVYLLKYRLKKVIKRLATKLWRELETSPKRTVSH